MTEFTVKGKEWTFYTNYHVPFLAYPEIWIQIWNKFPQEMEEATFQSFRTQKDLNLHMLYMILDVNHDHRHIYKMKTDKLAMFGMMHEGEILERVFQRIKVHQPNVVCLNDNFSQHLTNFELENMTRPYYEAIFPTRSLFEKKQGNL